MTPPDAFGGAFADAPVLITGGLGFIGSTLARRLASLGARVTVVDSMLPGAGGNLANLADIRDRVQINISDVRDPNSFRYLVRGQRYLFNLAGQVSHIDSMRDPFTDLEINARSQLSMMEACRHHNPDIRVVFTATRQQYGRALHLPIGEEHPQHPVDVNGINSIAGESYHILYHQVYGIRATSLRLTNTYGPRMLIRHNRQTAIGWLIRLAVEGKPIDLFGDGQQRRDFNYVDDVVEAILLAATHPAAEGEIFNLGGDPVSLRDAVELLVQVAESPGGYRLVPFPPERKAIDIGDVYTDYAKIARTLGWHPRTTLRDGLARSVAFYREHFRDYVPEGE
ncbi:MAG: NAD-dependent epimerase/dehydratase family protein [Thermomicrobiales bacterium]